MRIALVRTRDDACPSDLRLDRHLAGELAAPDGRAVEAHRAICASCLARAARHGDIDLPPLRVRSTRRARAVWPAAALLAAAAAVLLFTHRGERAPELESGTRIQGDDSVTLYVQHAGVLRPAQPDEPVEPGDTIQLTTTLAAPRWIAVLSVDGAGVVSVYHGDDPGGAAQTPGDDVPLPTSVKLDETLGRETIHVLLCRAPLALGPIVEALRDHPARAPAQPGCQLETLRLDKRAPR